MITHVHTRRLVLVTLAWTAVVALGSTLVWTVISSAGRDLASSDVTASTAVRTTGSPVAVTPTTPGRRPRADVTTATPPDEPPSPGPSAPAGSPQPAQPAQPAPPPAAAGGTTTPAAPSAPGGVPSSGPTTTQPVPPAAVRRTWQGEAGTVVAECRGARIALVGAQPNSGWRVEVGGTGPEELSVQFQRSAPDDDGAERAPAVDARDEADEVEVKGRCVDGAPSLTLD